MLFRGFLVLLFLLELSRALVSHGADTPSIVLAAWSALALLLLAPAHPCERVAGAAASATHGT